MEKTGEGQDGGCTALSKEKLATLVGHFNGNTSVSGPLTNATIEGVSSTESHTISKTKLRAFFEKENNGGFEGSGQLAGFAERGNRRPQGQTQNHSMDVHNWDGRPHGRETATWTQSPSMDA